MKKYGMILVIDVQGQVGQTLAQFTEWLGGMGPPQARLMGVRWFEGKLHLKLWSSEPILPEVSEGAVFPWVELPGPSGPGALPPDLPLYADVG